jgi:hypothetical protein
LLGAAITALFTNIPLSRAVLAPTVTALLTELISPVRVIKAFPPIPIPNLTSIRSTLADLTAASAATIADAILKNSNTPKSLNLSTLVDALIAGITCG